MPNHFNEDIERPEFHCIQSGHITRGSVYKVYPLCHLDLLIAVISQLTVPIHSILFIVDDGGCMWFAGYAPSNLDSEYPIPMHYQMTGRSEENAYCMTAGVIEFSKDYKTMIRLNNKSCSFKPTFDSLKWAISILCFNKTQLEQCSIQISPDLILEEYSSYVGGFQGNYHSLNMEEITPWINRVFKLEEKYLVHQLQGVRECRYQPIQQHKDSFYSSVSNRHTMMEMSQDAVAFNI